MSKNIRGGPLFYYGTSLFYRKNRRMCVYEQKPSSGSPFFPKNGGPWKHFFPIYAHLPLNHPPKFIFSWQKGGPCRKKTQLYAHYTPKSPSTPSKPPSAPSKSQPAHPQTFHQPPFPNPPPKNPFHPHPPKNNKDK